MAQINNTEDQIPKASKLAVVFLVISFLSLFLGFFLITPYCLASLRLVMPIVFLMRNLAFIPALVGLIFAIFALYRISNPKYTMKGTGFAITAIVFTTVFLGVWLWDQVCGDAYRPQNATNLHKLGTAILYYSRHNGKYPQPEKWCDLLIEKGYVNENNFVYTTKVLYWPLTNKPMLSLPFGKKGRCHYALNPDCRPDSPPNMVLLFETKAGWNQSGGPELLSTERHDEQGCNIMCNDKHVTFERTEDLDQLNWTNNQSQ